MRRGEGKEEMGDEREEIAEGKRDRKERKDGGERRKERRDAPMSLEERKRGGGKGESRGGR